MTLSFFGTLQRELEKMHSGQQTVSHSGARGQPAAADLLRVCSFLAPEAIPLELLSEGASHLGPRLAPVAADTYLLDQAIESLLRYSLVRRDAGSNSLSVHRLVQTVLYSSTIGCRRSEEGSLSHYSGNRHCAHHWYL